ncbi:hypothetical protein SAMN05421846_10230 [Chryseobacterium taeanense]|uniref:Uncharacterized protein n=2 Tax=Chryseobacterium group TaxID=2782232 RepID=A0A1G8F7D5_9FLAO|nr:MULTISPECIES: hypothetical protein [Chryseobacterium group]SDH78064.1 hypothetical protein SAMN05421846_10230 [Chryseobacterium taeanense]SMP85895.1 hypothetical protein SAMN05421679_10136 [Epilithonimonas pallida]
MEIIIKIKSNTRLNDVDNLYQTLYSAIKKKNTISLQIPKSFSRNFFSITSSLIQFTATWIQSGFAKRLLLNIENYDPETLERLYEQEFIFPIIALVWNDVTIEDLKQNNLRPYLRRFQNDYILKMRRIEAMKKGEKMLLASFDHFDNATGLLPYFETSKDFIGKEDDLKDSLRKPFMESILKYTKSYFQNSLDKVYDDFIGIIYELIKNTQEWGKEDVFNVPITPNIRGLFVKFYKRGRKKLIEEYTDESAIVDFFSNETTIKSNKYDEVYFMEISVFDGGSGFVKKFINDTDEILDDVSIIKKCLIKNQTSSVGIFKREKGKGLDRILQILDSGNGFLRIKTDKYCLYRNLVKEPYKDVENGNYEQMELFDWNSNSTTNFTTLQYSSGSVISLLYPLPQISDYTNE